MLFNQIRRNYYLHFLCKKKGFLNRNENAIRDRFNYPYIFDFVRKVTTIL